MFFVKILHYFAVQSTFNKDMDKQKYIDDLKDIKDIMDRSSKFISLSGLSGIACGVCALIGAYGAYVTVYAGQNYLYERATTFTFDKMITLLVIALVTISSAIGFAILFTVKRAKKIDQKIWNKNTKVLLINLAIPIVTGGVLAVILLSKGYVGIIAPLTLIFYGLALVNGSKYTLSEIRSLGLMEILLGLLATYFIGYGLIFWAVGFGLLNICYGILMYNRYRS